MSRTGFPAAAKVALADAQLRRNVGKATTSIRAKRATVVQELPDWQALRDAGAAIKARAMATLPEQLERLEAAVTAAGGTVHWARDGAEANAIVSRIARGHGAREVIKVKSLATDEIGLNDALARDGVAAIETDLAELILQLAGDHPSHILVPAIHRNRAEIRALFERTIARGEILTTAPTALADAARRHLREKFMTVPVAVSGANFAVAETGTIVLDGSAPCGRRALTLVPDHYVCVVRADQVVVDVPDAIAALRRMDATRRPITLVSGPSATSDIELERVEGVHGPRMLDVVVVRPRAREPDRSPDA